jgi:hypothetical protein
MMWRNFQKHPETKREINGNHHAIQSTLTKWDKYGQVISINMPPFFGDLPRHPLGDQGRARQEPQHSVPWAVRSVLLEQDLVLLNLSISMALL